MILSGLECHCIEHGGGRTTGGSDRDLRVEDVFAACLIRFCLTKTANSSRAYHIMQSLSSVT